MQNIIDKSYFWGEIEITGMFKPEVEGELNKFIAKYQKIYLHDMFNGEFDTEIPVGVLAMLKDEETYTSPIANFVYVYWQAAKQIPQTNAGVKGLNTQNTVAISPDYKAARAWNEMVRRNGEIHEYLYNLEGYDYLNLIYPYLTEYKLKNGYYPYILEYKNVFGI